MRPVYVNFLPQRAASASPHILLLDPRSHKPPSFITLSELTTYISDTATRCFLSLLPTPANHLVFEPTGCIVSPANERSRLYRKPLLHRLLSLDMFMHFAYIIYASTPPLLRFFFLAYSRSGPSFGPLPSFPFAGPVVKLLSCIWMASLPLRYMIFPPTVPEREELMELDDEKVRRPKQKWGESRGDGDGFWSRTWPWPWTWMDGAELGFVSWLFWQ